MPYEILDVEPESLLGDEQLGSKPKVWFLHKEEEWLFKEARTNTGEDWAEVVAAQVARLIDVKAADVKLATCRNRNGSASKSFIDRQNDNLFHGNELLAGQIMGYERDKRQRQSDHTLSNINRTISKLFAKLPNIRNSVLAGLGSYLVLDALIGNTDRHHENWGLVLEFLDRPGDVAKLRLSPSFDHASSLGRELSDLGRVQIIENRGIGGYVRRGRGGIYRSSEDPHGANPLGLVEFAAREYPDYFQPALRNLAATDLGRLAQAVEEVPASRMSGACRAFAIAMMKYSYNALTELIL
jgi:hypothetical protein